MECHVGVFGNELLSHQAVEKVKEAAAKKADFLVRNVAITY